MTKKILHIDFDSFFASCEQQFNSELRNKPIGVTARNGRTCIIASSSQAKKFGIKTGTRTWEATKIYPQIIFVPADFNKYLEVSKKFLKICTKYSPFVEVFSIDELFIDITLTEHLFGNVKQIVQEIKKNLRKEVGEYITVSVGLSYNKLLAKMASSLRKPDGFMEIKKENLEEIYRNATLTDVCGIGERVKARLNKIGVMTLIDLKNIDLNFLTAELGEIEGNFLKKVGLGIDNSPVVPYTTPSKVKSVGRNYCLPKNEYNQRVVLQNIYELCEEVAIKLRRLNKKARTIGLSLRGSNNFSCRKTFRDYFDTGKEIYRLCSYLTGGSMSMNYVRQISVWVTNLEDTKNIPLSLFDSSKRNEKLISAIDKINDKLGDHTIRKGFLLYADKLTTQPNGYLADKYERVKLSQL